MTSDEARAQLKEKIKLLDISENAQKALFALATDPHGYQQSSAPSLIASQITPSTTDMAHQVLLELFGKRLIIAEEQGGETRFWADYDVLGIDESLMPAIMLPREAYKSEGEPHSQSAMQGLEAFFLEQDGEIYVAAEITSHHVFQEVLSKRALSGRKTTFLIPRKNDVSNSQRANYDEVLKEWVTFVKSGPKYLRQNTRLRITARPFPELYTTAISINHARVNARSYSVPSTRSGAIHVTPSGTTLFDLLESRYSLALGLSCPLWRLRFLDYTWHWFKRLLLPIGLVSVALGLAQLKSPIAQVAVAIIAGMLVAIVSNALGVREWWTPKLFKK